VPNSPPTTTAPPAPAAPAGSPTEWSVAPGESFWTIAADLASMKVGHPASAQEIDPVWRALIDANRDRLPRAGNPSLLFVGTMLTLPL
jgi:hypothetical protein